MNSDVISVAADRHIYHISQLRNHPKVELFEYDPHTWNPSELKNKVDALLIRTVTVVDESLISGLGKRLKYISTATSGSDHVDKNLLSQNGISFSDAKGCNAKAVAEYTLTGMLYWCSSQKITPGDLTVGIAGIGHVGSKVARLCREAGFNTICYDPLRSRNTDDTFAGDTKDQLFSSDIITIHTPLTTRYQSAFPTQNWISRELIESSTNVKLWINAARGGIMDDLALSNAIAAGKTEAIIDCWLNEPHLSQELLKRTVFATPHIAGYSVESKLNATRMAVMPVLNHFRLETVSIEEVFHPNTIRTHSLSDDLRKRTIDEIIEHHGMLSYEKKLKEASADERANRFKEIRTEHPLRREFGWLEG